MRAISREFWQMLKKSDVFAFFSGSRKLDHFLLDKEVKQFEKCIADEQANDPFDFLTNPFEVNGYFFHA